MNYFKFQMMFWRKLRLKTYPSNVLILHLSWNDSRNSLREKCPNTELFLVHIFLHSDWIWRDTTYLCVFSPNTGKYGPEITLYLDTFHVVTANYHRNSLVQHTNTDNSKTHPKAALNLVKFFLFQELTLAIVFHVILQPY